MPTLSLRERQFLTIQSDAVPAGGMTIRFSAENDGLYANFRDSSGTMQSVRLLERGQQITGDTLHMFELMTLITLSLVQ